MNYTSSPKCDLSKYRAILEARIADLERNIRSREDIAVERTPDAVDEIQRASERALATSHMDRQSKQLQEVPRVERPVIARRSRSGKVRNAESMNGISACVISP
jgi:predicted SPOUT superfamily RNA methylase MTH1